MAWHTTTCNETPGHDDNIGCGDDSNNAMPYHNCNKPHVYSSVTILVQAESPAGEGTAKRVGTAAEGATTIQCIGEGIANGEGTAEGATTIQGIGEGIANGEGTAEGATAIQGIGEGIANGEGTANGATAIQGIGEGTAMAEGTAKGATTNQGIGKGIAHKATRI